MATRRFTPRAYPGGFTIVELALVLALLVVLLGVAAPSAVGLLAPYRLGGAARQVATDLQLVRMKAIAQNRRFRARFTAGSPSYSVERGNGGGGWDPYALHGHTTAGPVNSSIFLPQGVTSSGGTVVFEPRGTSSTGLNVALGHPVVPTTKRVAVNLAGRVTLP